MKSHVERRYLAGIILLAAGIVLLFKYYNIVPFNLPYYVFSWKTLLIVLGFVFLITDRNKSTGIILMGIGTVFLMTDVFSLSLGEVLRFSIPIALIIAGLFLVLRKPSFRSRNFNTPEGEDTNDFLNDVSIFGGGEKTIRTQSFKGGDITAIFGGSDIDLRASELAPGVNALEMLCVFGGVTLRVPDDWDVKNEVTAVFGGFSDKRKHLDKKNVNSSSEKVLYLKGTVLFGGGELK